MFREGRGGGFERFTDCRGRRRNFRTVPVGGVGCACVAGKNCGGLDEGSLGSGRELEEGGREVGGEGMEGREGGGGEVGGGGILAGGRGITSGGGLETGGGGASSS